MKGLFCVLILFAASAGLAQNPVPTTARAFISAGLSVSKGVFRLGIGRPTARLIP